MPEDRNERRDRDRERGEDEERRERRHCRTRHHHGDVSERIELLKRAPVDDAREFLISILDLSFREGWVCGQEEMCRCATQIVRATCCCRRHEHEEREEWGRDDDEEERGRSGRRSR